MTTPEPRPETGGVWLRDPQTGALVPAPAAEPEPPMEPAPAPAPAPMKKGR